MVTWLPFAINTVKGGNSSLGRLIGCSILRPRSPMNDRRDPVSHKAGTVENSIALLGLDGIWEERKSNGRISRPDDTSTVWHGTFKKRDGKTDGDETISLELVMVDSTGTVCCFGGTVDSGRDERSGTQGSWEVRGTGVTPKTGSLLRFLK